MDEPLIYTKNGNVPIASLTYRTAWEVTPQYTKFMERYLDSTGEVVKESAHVYSTQGVLAEGVASNIGG